MSKLAGATGDAAVGIDREPEHFKRFEQRLCDVGTGQSPRFADAVGEERNGRVAVTAASSCRTAPAAVFRGLM